MTELSVWMGPSLAGAAAGLGVAVPMGAMSVLLLQEAIRSRRAAVAGATGIAVVDFGYAALAVAVGPWVASHVAPIEAWVRLAAATILLTIATQGLRPRPTPPAPGPEPGSTPPNPRRGRAKGARGRAGQGAPAPTAPGTPGGPHAPGPEPRPAAADGTAGVQPRTAGTGAAGAGPATAADGVAGAELRMAGSGDAPSRRRDRAEGAESGRAAPTSPGGPQAPGAEPRPTAADGTAGAQPRTAGTGAAGAGPATAADGVAGARATPGAELRAAGAWRVFGRYVALTAVNPTTALYFAALTTAQGSELHGGAAATAFVGGVLLASLAWQQFLAALGSFAGSRISPAVRNWSFRLGYGLVAAYALKVALPLPWSA
ncbi:LysE family transporter [Streptomyces sp. NPDC002054]|uniref:LysE family transporter n=1 Tax=Streptomyces sp. NPDC002054 TaxID=3154663 RepID=UPI00332AC683